MTSKLNEGDRITQKFEKVLDNNSNGNRYSRSYKSKSMERYPIEKKQARTKGRLIRPDDLASTPITGPIKIREKARLMNDAINIDEPTKTSILKIKDKGKIVESSKDDLIFMGSSSKIKDKMKVFEVSKDDSNVLAASPKGREKGKAICESVKDETILASPLKLREKMKNTDNIKEDSFSPVASPRGRDKAKQNSEPPKSDQSPLLGISPIKLREKLKAAEILKEVALSSSSAVPKGQEKSKLSVDNLVSVGSISPIKLREKMKILEAMKDDGGTSISSLSKEQEKVKMHLQPFKDESIAKISPVKLREKVKMIESSRDDSVSSCVPSLKMRDKVKPSNDSTKDPQCNSPSATLIKPKERGRIPEKQDDSPPITALVKIREKSKVIADTDDDPLSSGIPVKKDKIKILGDELKNGDDALFAKKELGLQNFQSRECMEHENDNDGSSVMVRREGKGGSFGKIRKGRSMISSAYSNKKPVYDSKLTYSRNEEKGEVSANDKIDINVNLRCGEIGSLNRTNAEEMMNADISSSRDQRGLSKFCSPLKLVPNRSTSRMNENSEWRPGDLAWGRIGQHPFWPCMASVDVDSGQFKKTTKVGRGYGTQSLHVQFFGDRGRHSWIPFKNTLKYEGREKLQMFSDGILAQTKKKDKKFISSFVVKPSSRVRWDTAIKEADHALSLAREHRKPYFQDLLLNKKRSKKDDANHHKEEKNDLSSTDKRKRRHSVSFEKNPKKLKVNPSDSEKKIQSRTPTRKKQGRSKK